MNARLVAEHEKWMRTVLECAEKGRWSVSPNPMVGACVVRGGRLIASGYHPAFGAEHAEVAVLRKAGSRARGATLYVNLEPCSSWGKTPPCTHAILEHKIKQVVVATPDPNRANHQKGIQYLKRQGLKVVVGILAAEARKLNESFFTHALKQRPFVTLKMAQSLDGKIATETGQSRWISGPAARSFVEALRAEQDAILVGLNTFCLDNPGLRTPVHKPRQNPLKPWRVVVGLPEKISASAAILKGEPLTFFAVSDKRMKAAVTRHRKFKNQLTLLPVREKEGHLDLKDLLKKLAQLGAAKILVEGGGELAWSLIRERLCDRAYWIYAPKIIGGRNAKTSVEGAGVSLLKKAPQCRITDICYLDSDVLMTTEFLTP